MKKSMVLFVLIFSVLFCTSCSVLKKPVKLDFDESDISYVKVIYTPGTLGNVIVYNDTAVISTIANELKGKEFEYWTTEEKRNNDFPYDYPTDVLYGSFEFFNANDEVIFRIFRDGFMEESTDYKYSLKIDGEIFGISGNETLDGAFDQIIDYSISQASEMMRGSIGIDRSQDLQIGVSE